MPQNEASLIQPNLIQLKAKVERDERDLITLKEYIDDIAHRIDLCQYELAEETTRMKCAKWDYRKIRNGCRLNILAIDNRRTKDKDLIRQSRIEFDELLDHIDTNKNKMIRSTTGESNTHE